MSRGHVVRLFVTHVILLATTAAAAAPEVTGPTRALGGVRLLESMEKPGLTLVGRVESVERLDRHGYRATLSIEAVLGTSEAHPDGPVEIAWEELATRRPARFGKDDRVLLTLEPLGSASIWRSRIPDAGVRAKTAAVAMQGEAFLRDPALGTVDILHHYLSLPPQLRDAPTGIAYLVALAADARPPLARSALGRLGGVDGLADRLTPKTCERLVAALERRDLESRFETIWKPVFERARGEVMAAALERAVVAARPELAPPRVFEALAIAASGLPAEHSRALGQHADAHYREVLVRTAPANSQALLRGMIEADTAPGVRAAALERLVSSGSDEALPAALAALADSDASVRAVAARSAASFGDAAVTGLRSVAYGEYAACAGSVEAPRSAIAGLSFAGHEGRRTLAEIASEHPDDSLRKLASIALGSLETHVH